MMKILKKKRKNGFTLIELIVVISILGILAAIAVPRFSDITTDAQTTADEASARTMLSAITMAEAKYSTSTPTVDEINEFLNEDIVIAAAATADDIWAVNQVADVWTVYKWDGTSSSQILP